MNRRYLLLFLIIALLIPFPTTIVPTWKLQVVDELGSICPNKEVTQTWAHYSIFIGTGNSQSEDRTTDENGSVEFPSRTVWAPLGWRIVGGMITNVLTLAHGSEGPDSSVHSSGMKDVAWISYNPEKPMTDKIVVHSCVYDSSHGTH